MAIMRLNRPLYRATAVKMVCQIVAVVDATDADQCTDAQRIPTGEASWQLDPLACLFSLQHTPSMITRASTLCN